MKLSENNIGEEYLELYDGQMASLSTKKLISDTVPELRFTAKGRELFALSESLYCKWLESGEDYSLVEKAIEVCRAAAASGEPQAVVKMAFYYDKDYIDADRTEEFRCRIACDYYSKVVYCEGMPKNSDGVASESEWIDLRRTATRMFADMLSGAKKSLSDYTDGKYSFRVNAERLRANFGIECAGTNDSSPQEDAEKFAETVLTACKSSKVRAPLFGILQLTAAEAKRVFAPKSEVMKICGDVNIWLDSGNVVKVNNTKAFNAALENLSDGGVWLYFASSDAGGHRYLSVKQRKDLCELLRKDGFARFIRLKDSAKERGKTKYVFSDDDVEFFITGKLTPLKSALDGLIDRVVCDNEWGTL